MTGTLLTSNDGARQRDGKTAGPARHASSIEHSAVSIRGQVGAVREPPVGSAWTVNSVQTEFGLPATVSSRKWHGRRIEAGVQYLRSDRAVTCVIAVSPSQHGDSPGDGPTSVCSFSRSAVTGARTARRCHTRARPSANRSGADLSVNPRASPLGLPTRSLASTSLTASDADIRVGWRFVRVRSFACAHSRRSGLRPRTPRGPFQL